VAANVAVAERAVGTYESALAAIVGRSPREVFAAKITRDLTQVRLLDVPEVPSGLPSDLLERRPDIRQVEAQPSSPLRACASMPRARSIFRRCH